MALSAFVQDLGERAAKTFAQAFLAVAGVSGAAADFQSIQWAHSAEVGVVAVVLSLLTSVASLNVGNSGTASLTKAVEPAAPTD